MLVEDRTKLNLVFLIFTRPLLIRTIHDECATDRLETAIAHIALVKIKTRDSAWFDLQPGAKNRSVITSAIMIFHNIVSRDSKVSTTHIEKNYFVN